MPSTPEHDSPEGNDADKPLRSPDVRRHRRRPAAVDALLGVTRTGVLVRGTAALGAAAVIGLGLTVGSQPPSEPINPATAADDAGAPDHADRNHEREESTPSDTPDTPDTSDTPSETPESSSEPEPDPEPQPVAGLDDIQMANAVSIVETGDDLGISKTGKAIALITAMQESKMLNLASYALPESMEYEYEGIGSDFDSVGLFQQRPSMGWGSVEQCMDVEYAATVFYERLIGISGWEDMDLTWAAQSVQGSAFPYAYAQWEDMAWAVIDEVE